MLKNYLRVALRTIFNNKIYSVIIVLGLAVGLAAFAIFAQIAGVKLQSDKFHKNAENIYGIVQVLPLKTGDAEHTMFTPSPLLPALKKELPGIITGVRLQPAGNMTIRQGDYLFYENEILFVDADFFEMFSFDLKSGNRNAVLARPGSIVLSQASARKYFGEENPVGKTLKLQNIDVTVSGVFKDLNRTSSIKAEFLVSFETLQMLGKDLYEWKDNRLATLLLIQEDIDTAVFDAQLMDVMQAHVAQSPAFPAKMYLFPLLDLRLKATHITTFFKKSHPSVIYITFFMGILILLIVAINFINLSTARYMHRAKEIGMRKIIGATKRQLIGQFLGESMLFALCALPLAILLYEAVHPILYTALNLPTNGSSSIWNYPFLLKYMVICTLWVGLFSGLYPALFLSSIDPMTVMKNKVNKGKKRYNGRRVLVFTQFALSVIFLVFANIVKKQLHHVYGADFGFSRDNVAVVEIHDLAPQDRVRLQSEIERFTGVELVTASTNLPIMWSNEQPAKIAGTSDDESFDINMYGVDKNFLNVLNLQLSYGQSFAQHPSEQNSVIINKSGANALRLQDPVGKQIIVNNKEATIIGLVEDYLFADIGFSMPSALLYLEKEDLNYLMIKFSQQIDFESIYPNIEKSWKANMPNQPFDCYTLNESFDQSFKIIMSVSNLLGIIGFVAVFFSCLGLFGLSSFVIERKTKEIGIRKVLGASVGRVLWSISREFFVLVLIANTFALLLAAFIWQRVMQTGLLFIQNISAQTYILAIVVSISMAIIAVSLQTFKAVVANPIEALRYE